MAFELPKYAYEYQGPAINYLKGLKWLLSILESQSEKGAIDWTPAPEGWGGDYPVRHCESSLRGRSQMFGTEKHPTHGGRRFYEGIWARPYHSLPNGILILMPYPSSEHPPLIYTISSPMEQWVRNTVSYYRDHVREVAT